MKKATRGDIIGILAVSLVFIVFLILIFNAWVRYWVYYKPFYTIFKDSLYLPFYLYITGYLILIVFSLFILIIYSKKSDKTKKSHITVTIIMSLFYVGVLYFWGRDIYNDMAFIGKEKYLTIECNINSLKKVQVGSRGRKMYEINSIEKIERKYVYVKMDFYQYRELLNKRKENKNMIITVYYLPNTERMLKYKQETYDTVKQNLQQQEARHLISR